MVGAVFYTSRAYFLTWIVRVGKKWYTVPYEVGGWYRRVRYYGDTRHLTRMTGYKSIARLTYKLTKGGGE